MANKKIIGSSIGDSMVPLIRPKDLISISRVDFKDIGLGSVVVFKQDEKIIGHRVVFRTKKWLLTKGDNTLVFDKKVFSGQVIGLIDKISRNSQTIDLNTSLNKLLGILIVLVSMGLMAIAKLLGKAIGVLIRIQRFFLFLCAGLLTKEK
jgi:signal peptidase I